MAIDIWGDKPKSQIDATTIDEEIAALIQAHEDDENAHLETGESLQSHKASEIIDHLAKSIVEDKIDDLAISSRCITTDQIVGKDIRTATDVGSTVDGVAMLPTGIEMWQDGEKKVDIPVSGNPTFKGRVAVNALEYLKFTVQSNFDSIDGFTTSGAVYGSFASVDLHCSDTLHNKSYLQLYGSQNYSVWPDISKSPSAEACFLVHDLTYVKFYFGLGDLDMDNGVGFEFYNGSLRAIWYDSEADYHYATIGSFTEEELHTFRVEVDYGVGVKWYVDGVLVKEKTWAELDIMESFGHAVTFMAYNQTAGYEGGAELTNIVYQQNI